MPATLDPEDERPDFQLLKGTSDNLEKVSIHARKRSPAASIRYAHNGATRQEYLETYMLVKNRGTQKPWSVLLALIVVLMVVQFGPLATSASANEPSPDACVYDEQINRQVLSDGTIQYWICHFVGGFKWWQRWDEIPGPGVGEWDEYGASTPPYRSGLVAWLGRGYTKDFATVAYELLSPNGTPYVRKMAVRLEVHNRTSGVRCVNGVWHETTSDHMTFTARGDWALQCGTGNYEVAVAGRFWSVSLNRWITNYWTRSGQLRLSPYV
jgi:hypothetical protein